MRIKSLIVVIRSLIGVKLQLHPFASPRCLFLCEFLFRLDPLALLLNVAPLSTLVAEIRRSVPQPDFLVGHTDDFRDEFCCFIGGQF